MEDQNLQETLDQATPEQHEQQQEDHVGEEQAPAQAQPTQNELNIRQLRQKSEQLERERNEYYQRLQDIESRKQQAPQEEDVQLNPDDLVEWKYVQKELKKVKDELNAYKQQSTTSSAEARIKSQYPDFESVVNSDNIAQLREQYPELAASINSNQDLYTKASAAYTLIKKLNIAPDTQYAGDRDRAIQNANKPRPLTSVNPQQGESPLSRANVFAQGLTPELKSQLLKEMQEAKKRI